MAVRKLPHMSACFHTFPENTLTALEEVLQMIRRKCGTDNPCPRKICTYSKAHLSCSKLYDSARFINLQNHYKMHFKTLDLKTYSMICFGKPFSKTPLTQGPPS